MIDSVDGVRPAAHAEVRARREDDVHPPAGVCRTSAPQDDDALAAIQGEGLPAQALHVRSAEDDIATGEQRVERGNTQLRGECVERLGGDDGDRGVPVRGAAGVAVADDAEPRPDLEPLTSVPGLVGDLCAGPPVVAVPGRGEQSDDLDDVQRGLAQDGDPAVSISP